MRGTRSFFSFEQPKTLYMKKLFLSCIFGSVLCVLHAQTGHPLMLKKFTPKTYALPGDGKQQYNNLLPQLQNSKPVDNMPVVTTLVQLTYIGNNGNGLDIYKAAQDNMPVVMPDKTFYNAMPVAGYKPQPLKTGPQGNRK